MGLADKLRRLDENAYSDAVYDQFVSPFSWWPLSAGGLIVLATGVADGHAVRVAAGVGLALVGSLFAVLGHRRDRRVEDARRAGVEADMARRRVRRLSG